MSIYILHFFQLTQYMSRLNDTCVMTTQRYVYDNFMYKKDDVCIDKSKYLVDFVLTGMHIMVIYIQTLTP